MSAIPRCLLCTLIHVIIFSCFVTYFGVDGSPSYPFQYQCYRTDVCYYPDEYCDSLLERCKQCAYVCNKAGKIPLGCQAFCAKESDGSFDVHNSIWQHEAWFVVSLVLFLSLGALVVLFVIHRCGCCQIPCLKTTTTDSGVQPDSGVKPEETPLVSGDKHKEEPESGVESLSSSEDIVSDSTNDKKAYCEEKLKNVPPTNSSRPTVYEPTIGSVTTSHSRANGSKYQSVPTADNEAEVENNNRKLNEAPTTSDPHSPRITTSASRLAKHSNRTGGDTASRTDPETPANDDPSCNTNRDNVSLQSCDEGEAVTDDAETSNKTVANINATEEEDDANGDDDGDHGSSTTD